MIFLKPINPIAINAALFAGFHIANKRMQISVHIDSLRELTWCGWVMDEFFGGYHTSKFGDSYIQMRSKWRVPASTSIDAHIQRIACIGFAHARALLRIQKSSDFIVTFSAGPDFQLWSWPYELHSMRKRNNGRDTITRWESAARQGSLDFVSEAGHIGYSHPRLKRGDYVHG